jgi:hypothetical protein
MFDDLTNRLPCLPACPPARLPARPPACPPARPPACRPACLPACHTQAGLVYQLPPAAHLQGPRSGSIRHLPQEWASTEGAHKRRCSSVATQQESDHSLVNDVLRCASGMN